MDESLLVIKELEPGYTVNQYVLTSRLGRGGFCEVWLAHHQNKNLHSKKYAIKFLANTDLKEQDRFEREMRILAKLDDNLHIINAVDCGEVAATFQMVNPTSGDVTRE